MQRIGFYLFLSLEKFLMFLPKKTRRSFFESLGVLAYYISTRYGKVVEQNLRFVFEDSITPEQIDEIKRYSFKQMLINFLHTMESRYYTPDEITQNITFENLEIVQKAQQEKRPIIFVTAHYGAWELAGRALSYKIEPILIIYKKMKNKFFENYLLSSREKWKMTYAERHGATRAMMKTLRKGGAMAILIDTNVNKNEAVKVKFLGHEISQIKTTAYFARKYNAALIPALIHTEDDENYTIRFDSEIVPPKTDNEERDIQVSMQMQTDWLSKEILKEPKPWFWLHRRFKEDYPEIYKRN
ncbi:lipid A biosynthesis lauroyl acyltransferase [Sulfurimonas paralvinellae]|uniref:Lipid A biosynthesis acyltransferase n=1 Tax=Sulfurimonas paralvinellae TaxID=317658 RepID=A0A7M1BBX0_9BACT|nr:lipid A biosynthesis lauroyl acyltransferase [Sulfurimonas paralvinellae]QOP46282.1 lipid A biosynthesis acyltransferase [Sulfurimonas paralvinellae]